MTDAQTALAQVREAMVAGPTPGEWSLKTVPTSDGSCHKIGPFPSASRIHSEAHACVYAIGIRLGIDDSTPVARELLANARLMAACSPANIAAILAHVDAQAAEIERLTAERDELRRQLAEAEQDARRYRDWLRGGANIPPESTRWARWEVRHWDGRHWNTLFAEQMDAAIDAAMGGGDAG